jgi:hypothetical protein
MSTIQQRLSTVSGKIQYLQHEKQRIEKEKEAIAEELKRLGIKDANALRAEIERQKKHFQESEAKLLEAVSKLEAKTLELEKSING